MAMADYIHEKRDEPVSEENDRHAYRKRNLFPAISKMSIAERMKRIRLGKDNPNATKKLDTIINHLHELRESGNPYISSEIR